MAENGPECVEAERESRRGMRLGSVAALVMVAIAGGAALLRGDESRVDARPHAERNTGPPAVAPSLGRLASPASLPREADKPPNAAPVGVPAEQFQVCGGDWIAPQADGSIAPNSFETLPHVRAARDRIIASLLADPDLYARAVGLWIGSAEPAPDPASKAARWQALGQRLAEAAARSDDPRLYGLAYGACSAARTEGSCAQLKAEQWARLDPDNGFPWLFVASEASQRRDDAARDEALYHLSVAPRYDSGAYDAPRVIAAHAARDDASLVATFMLGIVALPIGPSRAAPYTEIVKLCGVRIDEDPNRWQTCSGAAALLAERSQTLLDRAIGRAMGRRLQWPVDRLDRLGGEAALWAKQQEALSAGLDAHRANCDGIRRWVDVFARADWPGEAGALQAVLAAKAPSEDELMRLGREERERREALQRAKDPPGAASAASMPSKDTGAPAAGEPTVASAGMALR